MNHQSKAEASDLAGRTGPALDGPFQHEDGATANLTSPSLNDVVIAFQSAGQHQYFQLRNAFEELHGKVIDVYFARSIHAGALLLKERTRWRWLRFRSRYRIALAYDSSSADPALDEALRKIRTEERQSAVLLGARAHQILVQTVYTLVVYLLNTLDSACRSNDEHDREYKQQQIDAAVASARRELADIEKFTEKAARRAALLLYLTGLPLGAIVGSVLVTRLSHFSG